ncbi:Nlrc5 [Symbiodinium sp. CCMP2592]|nr:Nlrc5 [Symbiodinium sp. CCMP2592]
MAGDGNASRQAPPLSSSGLLTGAPASENPNEEAPRPSGSWPSQRISSKASSSRLFSAMAETVRGYLRKAQDAEQAQRLTQAQRRPSWERRSSNSQAPRRVWPSSEADLTHVVREVLAAVQAQKSEAAQESNTKLSEDPGTSKPRAVAPLQAGPGLDEAMPEPPQTTEAVAHLQQALKDQQASFERAMQEQAAQHQRITEAQTASFIQALQEREKFLERILQEKPVKDAQEATPPEDPEASHGRAVVAAPSQACWGLDEATSQTTRCAEAGQPVQPVFQLQQALKEQAALQERVGKLMASSQILKATMQERDQKLQELLQAAGHGEEPPACLLPGQLTDDSAEATAAPSPEGTGQQPLAEAKEEEELPPAHSGPLRLSGRGQAAPVETEEPELPRSAQLVLEEAGSVTPTDDNSAVPHGMRFQFFLDLIEEKREWLEKSTARGKGRKNMYDVCPEVIIERTTCEEQILVLSEADAGKIARSLADPSGDQSIFLPDSLQCRSGVHLGGMKVDELAIQGILCDGGGQRREYWAARADRQQRWMTTSEHGRLDKGPAEIPSHLQKCGKLGEKSARREKELLKQPGTVVVLRRGVPYAQLEKPGELGLLTSFVSHAWGEETLEFAHTLKLHARNVNPSNPGALAYYICTFCNSQHSVDLGGDDWRQSPFNLALEHVASRCHQKRGSMYRAVMLFDRSCSTLKRKWCIFEIFRCQSLGLELDLYCRDGELTRASESQHAKEILQEVMDVDMMAAECSEKKDEITIDGAISDHPSGWTGVVSKVKMQVMGHLSFVAHMAMTRDAFTGQQVEPEQGIELEGSAGKVSLSELIDGCMQACLSACLQSAAGQQVEDENLAKAQLKRMLITGQGGTGKTVITREIVRAAVKLVREKALRLVPLRVPLAELARCAKEEGDMLQVWAVQAFGKDGQELLQGERQLLLLLDGLDEAGTDRRRIISWLDGWLRQNSHRCACVVLTSRPSGTDQVVDQEGKAREPSRSSVLHASEKCLITQDSFPQGSHVLLTDKRDLVIGNGKVPFCEQGFVLRADCCLQPPGCHVRVRRKDRGGWGWVFSPAITLHYSDSSRAKALLEQAWREATGRRADLHRKEARVVVTRADGQKWEESSSFYYKRTIHWATLLDWSATEFPCRAFLALMERQYAEVEVEDLERQYAEVEVEDLELRVEACGDDVFVSAAGLAPGCWLLTGEGFADKFVRYSTTREDGNELLPTEGAFRTLLEGQNGSADALAGAAFVSEMTLRAELSEQLQFQPLQLLPLSPGIAARISKAPEQLLETLPDVVWDTPLMASILGECRKQQEQMDMVTAELDLMEYALRTLIKKAEERTGRRLCSLGPRCLEKLQAGHRLFVEADFEDQVVFQEAQRGHLRLFEPVAGQSAVQVYHLKMHELLAAKAWKEAAGVNLQVAFEQARNEPMLRGAARFLVMMQTAESPEASVDLSNCKLGAADVEALRGALLCRGPRLKIDLSVNRIGDAGATCLADALSGLTSLRELDVELGGSGLELGVGSLAEALEKLPELTKLCLSLGGNQLGDFAACLAGVLSGLTSLRELRVGLFNTGLGPEGVGSLAEALEKLPELAKLCLELGRNELGGFRLFYRGNAGATCLADVLSGLTSLRELRVGLFNTGLGRGQRRPTGPEGVGSLAEALEKLPELAQLCLYLRENELGGFRLFYRGNAGATCLADVLSGLTSLRELRVGLFNTGLGRGQRRPTGPEGVGSLAEALEKLPELAQLCLYLRENELGPPTGTWTAGNKERRNTSESPTYLSHAAAAVLHFVALGFYVLEASNLAVFQGRSPQPAIRFIDTGTGAAKPGAKHHCGFLNLIDLTRPTPR